MMNDKTKHYIVGCSIGLLTLPISYFTGLWWAYFIVIWLSIFPFILKEVYDVYKPHPTGFDKFDILADYMGLIAGFIISFIIYHLIQMFK